MKRFHLILSLLFVFSVEYFAQSGDFQIGTNDSRLNQNQGALYDYSDPQGINMKVSVWGYVKFPGKYIMPAASSLDDLMSVCGGPTQDANLEVLRIYRAEKDSNFVIQFNYNDLLWDYDVKDITIPKTPELIAGDILMVPGEPRLFFKDYLLLSLSVVSTIASLAILILNIAE